MDFRHLAVSELHRETPKTANASPPAISAPLLPPSGTDGDIRPAFALDGSAARIRGGFGGEGIFFGTSTTNLVILGLVPRTQHQSYAVDPRVKPEDD